jgi:hypothetical protein
MVSPMNFIASKNSCSFIISGSALKSGINDIIFRILLPDYYFELGFVNSVLYLKRNSDQVQLKAPSEGDVMFHAIWDTTYMTLIYQDNSYDQAIRSGANNEVELQKRTQTIFTTPTLPTNSVLLSARKLNLIPTTTYQSPNHFFQAVLLTLQSIDDKLLNSNMYNSFWDFQFEQARIVGRKPKKERDVVAAVHGLLFDVAALKNYQIHPESPAAVGNLDFLINGVLETGEFVSCCIEFKHAHNPDLNNGLLKQLPAYMSATGSNYGIYCILYFKGAHFDLPDENVPDMEYKLKNLAFASGLRNINVITLNLSRPKPPSKL